MTERRESSINTCIGGRVKENKKGALANRGKGEMMAADAIRVFGVLRVSRGCIK